MLQLLQFIGDQGRTLRDHPYEHAKQEQGGGLWSVQVQVRVAPSRQPVMAQCTSPPRHWPHQTNRVAGSFMLPESRSSCTRINKEMCICSKGCPAGLARLSNSIERQNWPVTLACTRFHRFNKVLTAFKSRQDVNKKLDTTKE
jgi:hypothetical protein